MTAPSSLPSGPLVAWYGDDFTGAAAVMELLALAGFPTILFLDPPTPEQLMRYSDHRGIGIAGTARTRTPEWMDAHLPEIFDALHRTGAALLHYKSCSTLDSSPHIGSIGRAVDVALKSLGRGWIPILSAAPPIGRYQAFGNLFASANDIVHRLDRHPAASRHPVTPMREADVREHLRLQTRETIGIIDIAAMERVGALAALEFQRNAGHRLVALDVMNERDLSEAGRLIWNEREDIAIAFGSQGVEYALLSYWRDSGLISPSPPRLAARAVDRIAAVSGSCAPITAEQISHAERNGFRPIRLDPAQSLDTRHWQDALMVATEQALTALGEGYDPLVFTALGPDDPAVSKLHAAVEIAGADIAHVNVMIGEGLGRILCSLADQAKIGRFAIAGGDTSGEVARALDVEALTFIAPFSPAIGLFSIQSDNADRQGCELSLKGGQMGLPDYFTMVRNGGMLADAKRIAL